MEPAINAAFSLVDYKITRFLFITPENEPPGISIVFNPSGKYQESTGVFKLTFEFAAFFKDENDIDINVFESTMVSEFRFEDALEFEKIPEFFYINSIAIVFPHLRAFVSTVTSLANERRIILPILNLTSLETILKENTSLVK